MAKSLIKTLQTEKTPLKHAPNTPTEYNPLKKSRQQIYWENYQKNKERKKQQRRERYQQDKERIKVAQKQKYQQQKKLAQSQQKENFSKYYGVEAIKILMSFKDYIQINKEKQKLWLDFNWTLKDCWEAIKEGLGDITAIMKLERVAGKLVRDYWTTAKSELEQKGKSWNVLDYDQQQKLIKYWSYEKARVENGYIEEWERLEGQGGEYQKEIERAKFHEERDKVNCKCNWCSYRQDIHNEVQAKIKKEQNEVSKEIADFWKEKDKKEKVEKEECPECGKTRVLDENYGVCKKCVKEYYDDFEEE